MTCRCGQTLAGTALAAWLPPPTGTHATRFSTSSGLLCCRIVSSGSNKMEQGSPKRSPSVAPILGGSVEIGQVVSLLEQQSVGYNAFPATSASAGAKAHMTHTRSCRVLFLCTGNYYRSRFAEALFNSLAKRAELNWTADSRGLATDRASTMSGQSQGPPVAYPSR